jgi:hypothetical protein
LNKLEAKHIFNRHQYWFKNDPQRNLLNSVYAVYSTESFNTKLTKKVTALVPCSLSTPTITSIASSSNCFPVCF